MDDRPVGTKQTLLAIRNMVRCITASHRVVVTVVQFSGEDELEKTYKAGNNGVNDGLLNGIPDGVPMYKFEIGPTALNNKYESQRRQI